MEVPGKEERRGYSVVVGNFANEPFNMSKITYAAFKLVGYPIEYDNNATDTKGNPRPFYTRVLTDSKDSRIKIRAIEIARHENGAPLNWLVADIRLGSARDIFDALTNPQNPLHKSLATLGEEILQKGLIAAVEIDLKKNKEESDPVTPVEIMEYYDNIKNNVPSLSEEEVVLIKANEIRQYLEKHSELKPIPQ